MVSVINLIIGGILALLGGAIIVSNLLSRMRCKVPLTVKIKALNAESVQVRGKKQTIYTPTFVYSVKGVDYKGVAPFHSNDPKKFKKGDKLEISYNPNNPGEYCIRGKQSNLTAGIIFFAGGALFLLRYFLG